MIFKPKTVDYELSPYTGLGREAWIEAAEHLLQGIFQNIAHFEDPVIMPRKENEITYPHLNAPALIQEVEKRAEIFEGLTRSLFLAAPLLKIKPDLELCGYHIADYYKAQILRSCSSCDPIAVGSYEKMQELTNHEDPFRAYQQTVETCALVIGLWISRDAIWDTYTKEEKDQIAGFLTTYAHANTVPQNWRLFNMLDLAFLNREGYPIDEEIMMDHASEILNYYAGDGWYRDGQSFDYYSCWAFNVYGPLWNQWYGYENAPDMAKRFEENSNELMKSYAEFFDADGYTNMWGRSNIYRNASTSAFIGNLFLKHSTVDCGLARRICSGSLMQFITREDFYDKGIPTMGFYGQFAPLVQGYSCTESPFWMGKAFLCLALPKDHPFWCEKENNGVWEQLEKREVQETTLNGPALCMTNHAANGSTILRSGKVLKNRGDEAGMWNYSKLSYHTKYPWESTPIVTKGQTERRDGEVESEQYVLKDLTSGEIQKCNATFWHGEKNGILYRRQFFDFDLSREMTWMQAMNLADYAVPYGIMRVDKIRFYRKPVSVTLGAYGFPDNGTQIIERQEKNAKAIILKGWDSQGRKKQLAMTIYDGWEELKLVKSCGTNPESEHSIILYAVTTRRKQYGSKESYVLVSQVITREDHEDFLDTDLFPIESITYADQMQSGGYGKIAIQMKDGSVKKVEFDRIEGGLSI